MPCRSDYPPLTKLESELIAIYNINDELDGKRQDYHLYHPEVYGKNLTYEDLDIATEKLCRRIQGISSTHDYSPTLKRWWLNHRITDFKRLIEEKAASEQDDLFLQSLSDYERELICTNNFLENIIDDSARKITKRFDGFNESLHETSQENIIKHNLVQIFAAFEHFCELMYLRAKPSTNELHNLFRRFEDGEKLVQEICKASYADWLTPDDYSKLDFYFGKYNVISGAHAKETVMYFDIDNASEEEIEKRKVTVDEVLDLIRIVDIVKEKMSDAQALEDRK